MTSKIFRSIFAVALAVLLAALVIIMGVLYGYYGGVQKKQLAGQTAMAARGVELEGMEYLKNLDSDCRLTWISPQGAVLYDSTTDAEGMENHLGREEVDEALATGVGESERYSTTLAEKTLYYARRLEDGSVLRVSVEQYTVLTLTLGLLQPFLVVMVLAVILSYFLARRLSRRIVEPLNKLDLEQPLENEAYEELAPLLSRIEHQHAQINRHLNELRRKRDEFSAVTGSMSEGLILLNERGVILSINPAAAGLFGIGADCVGRDVLTVDRSLPMQRLIASALAGRHDEAVETRDGRHYQIDASPVLSEGKVSGVVILTFDATERFLAEQQRREFSANVSHELKTPLQSIMGSAELLENGLVKPADIPRFVGHIRSEAARMVTLIDDIIRLSQLDEGEAVPTEPVDLLALTQEAVRSLRDAAEKRRVTFHVQGAQAQVEGVRRMLYEIVYNLCDNAVKYNVEGGSVDVAVEDGPGQAVLTVSDTGIGIPPEHQARVFERFYRVDKSHSRETGGTGLGLSIVKHAAQYHGAALELQSAPGEGTRITVRFPKK